MPQPPQLFNEVWVLTSQPFAATPSQSSKPALHDRIAQPVAVQRGVALARLQVLPQLLQWVVLVFRLASQPSASSALQSANPAAQAPKVQLPDTQVSDAFNMLQTAPQPPQLASDEAVFTSQPLAGFASQLVHPSLQAFSVQVVPLQAGTPLANEHTFPQAPQALTLLTVAVSHPLASAPSQLPKPASQVPIEQVPPEQTSLAFVRAHNVPHEPQLASDVLVLTSQPVL